MKTRFRIFVAGVIAALISCGGRSQNLDGGSDDGGEGATGGTGSSRGGRSGTSGTGPSGGTDGNSGGAPGGTSGAIGGTGALGGTGAVAATAGVIGGAGATTGGTGGRVNGVPLDPDANGCVDLNGPSFGVRGCFYVFGDQYGDAASAKCLMPGLHTPAECSIIQSPPPPPALGFPQDVPGVMCTTGTVAQVLPCPPTIMTAGCPMADYANMWGAGVGFDFNADKPEDGGSKHPWDATLAGFIGFSFDIDLVPLSGLRIEIPMALTDAEAAAASPPLPSGATTNDHPEGSPYWGASSMYPNSPVVNGTNRVLWTDIRPPRPQSYSFDPTRLLGIQFHVPTNTQARAQYGFCIKNLTLLRE